MKTAIAIGILGAFAAVMLLSPAPVESNPGDLEAQFLEYLQDFGKSYHDVSEYKLRLLNFVHSMKTHGAINKFSDWSQSEFNAYLTYKSDKPQQPHTNRASNNGKAIDWSANDSAVKDQGSCGSCWAFAASAGAESLLKIHHDIDADLSEQQQMDCSYSFGNLACMGGLMANSWNYFIEREVGWCSNKDYPYKQ